MRVGGAIAARLVELGDEALVAGPLVFGVVR
jgi:hypothetical protein